MAYMTKRQKQDPSPVTAQRQSVVLPPGGPDGGVVVTVAFAETTVLDDE